MSTAQSNGDPSRASPIQGKICLVTGATSGMGRAIASELARLGAQVIAVGRNRERGAALVKEIRQRGGNAEFIPVDLSSQAAIWRLAERVGEQYPHLDVLINNAAAMFGDRQISIDNLEMTFAVNHLAYFLLTNLLLAPLQNAPSARVINISSSGHQRVTLDFDDLQSTRQYDGWRAYMCSKLANVYFSYELARLLEGSVKVNAVDPGFVATDIGARNDLMPPEVWQAMTRQAVSPEQAAQASVQLASAESLDVTGQYFSQGRPISSSPISYDQSIAKRLWEVSAELTGL